MMYVSYAYAHGSWANPALIGVSVFVGVFLPSYSKLSNKAELWANNQFGFVTAGKLGRFLPQLAFNLAVIWLCFVGGAFNLAVSRRSAVGPVRRSLTTLASQGTQYLGGYLVARGIGDANRNTIVSIVVQHGPGGAGHGRPAGCARGLPDPGLWARRAVLRYRSAVGPALRAGAQGRHRVVLRNLQSVPQFTSDDRAAGAGRAAARQDHHPSDAHPASACRRLPQGRDPRRPAERRRLPDLREDRQGRFQRRLLPDRQHVPAARDAQGADRAGARRGRARQQGRSRVLSRRPTTPRASRA